MLDWIDSNLQPNDIFFDVGANIGIYSLYGASKKIINTKFYCFEPEYSNLNELKFNIIQNNFTDKIFPFSIAFGKKKGLSYFNIYDSTPGAALHTISLENSNKKNIVINEGVAIYSVDNFCEELNVQPNLIKIDIDGNEYDLLLGAAKTLNNKNLRSIIIELDDKNTSQKCINYLKENGFILAGKFQSNQSYVWNKT